MKKIQIEIDCGERLCDGCGYLDITYCLLFSMQLNTVGESVRTQKCYKAEVKEPEFEYGEKVLIQDDKYHNQRGEYVTRIKETDSHIIRMQGCFWEFSGKALKKYKPQKRVKKASEIVKWLEDNGYTYVKDGDFRSNVEPVFKLAMFNYCGEVIDDHKDSFGFVWLDEWLEEID